VVRRASGPQWFTRLVVAAAVVDALEELKLRFPKVDGRQRAELRVACSRASEPGRQPRREISA
jgi:hypothetical protein